MKLDLDTYAYLCSPLHQWEPRYKLIGLGVLMFAFAFVKDWRLLPAMLIVTAIFYASSHLSVSFLISRLRYPSCFLLGIIALLPFLSGATVIWQWGPLTLRQEGCLAVVLIICRFFSIVILGLILLNTTPLITLVKTMRSLGLPAVLADMTLLTYRYLHEIAKNLATMQIASRLRNPRKYTKPGWRFMPDIEELKLLAFLAGTLLLRSYEQSERVYQSMCLRGYGNETIHHHGGGGQQQQPFWRDLRHVIALLITLLVAMSFVVAELVLNPASHIL